MRLDRDVVGYFVTFSCYGTWLHGDERGSKYRRRVGDVVDVEPNVQREAFAREQSRFDPVRLDLHQRRVVDAAIREACEFKGWYLPALNVRTNHVHLLASAQIHPDRIVSTVKERATFRLPEATSQNGRNRSGRKARARAGSGPKTR